MKQILLFLSILLCPSTYALTLKHLGTHYGGWTIPTDLINANSVCYCIGAGEDISFDIALINTFGCNVYCFDPTPKAINHVQEVCKGFEAGTRVPINHGKIYYQLDDPTTIKKLFFFSYGIWDTNTILNFYFPKNPNHVSCSALNLQHTNDFVPVTCKTLRTIMQELGHTHIDVLKLDIEGAEYPVVNNMLSENILPTVLCIEFHTTKQYNKNTYITLLKNVGYTLVCEKGQNVTFVKH